MPAQDLDTKEDNVAYSHVFNKAIDDRSLFGDPDDYEVFLAYLKDYVGIPATGDTIKKDFTVNGRTFRGVPHLPKNYYNKVELVAYSMMPDHFHLVIRELTPGTIEKLVRSLCIRYAIYYNKKYQRSGSLFVGPYKSVGLNNSQLLLLSRFIHRESISQGTSSYKYFLEAKESSWLRPEAILSQLDNPSYYKNLVENDQFEQVEKEALSKLSFEKINVNVSEQKQSVLQPDQKFGTYEVRPSDGPKSRSRKPEFFAVSISSFILLFALGVRSVMNSQAEATGTSHTPVQPTPEVAGLYSDEKVSPTPSPNPTASPTFTPTPTPSPVPETIVVIKIEDGSQSVNIRKEPTIVSEVVGKAFQGDAFEFMSEDAGWYQIKLDETTSGFVSPKYAKILEGVNQ